MNHQAQKRAERAALGIPGIEHPLYIVWKNMRYRCEKEYDKDYPRYGGRGITVCEQWQSFPTFYLWAVDAGWSRELQLDRINNDGPYSPDNCKFSTRIENMNNRRVTRRFEYEGGRRTARELYDILQPVVKMPAFLTRLQKGWTPEEAATTPKNGRYRENDYGRHNALRLEYEGRFWTTRELFDAFNPPVTYSAFLSRIARGWCLENALDKPKKNRE